MESMRHSHVSLLLGIALGVCGFCVGMMPLNMGSGSVFGGVWFYDWPIEGHLVAVDLEGNPEYCHGTRMQPCSDYPYAPCTGGWAIVALCGGSYTTHASGPAGCLGASECTVLYDATCTYD
jgi:hypothetical protein